MGKALLVILLAPFTGLLLGMIFGALAFPLYKILTTHSQFLASLTGTFQEIPSSSADEPARDD
jgi:hypothetical protein